MIATTRRYLIMFVTIILTGSMFSSFEIYIPIRHILYALFAFLLFWDNLNYFKLKHISKKIFTMLICGLLFCLISVANYRDTAIEVVKICLYFFLLLGYCKNCNKYKINVLKITADIVYIISIIALLFWVSINIINISLPNHVIHDSTTYYNYMNLYLHAPIYRIEIGNLSIFRLQSFFWEPGVYGIFLSYALFYHLRFEKKTKLIRLIVIVVSTILTLSTTCICIAIVLFAYYKFEDIKSIKKKILMILPIGVCAVYGLVYIFLQKMNTSIEVNASYYLRTLDINSAIQVWKEHFLFGTGLFNSEPFLLCQGLNRECSNGFLTWAYQMGLVGVFVWCYPFVCSIIKKHNSNLINSIVFFVLFCATTMTEPLMYRPFILFIIAYQYCSYLYGTNI